MPVDVDRKSSKTPISSGFQELFYSDVGATIAMSGRHGPSLRLPHSRAFGDGLFELRPRGRSGIGRAFYCYLLGKRVVVLHAFIKKSQQTPDNELKMARKRLKEVMHG